MLTIYSGAPLPRAAIDPWVLAQMWDCKRKVVYHHTETQIRLRPLGKRNAVRQAGVLLFANKMAGFMQGVRMLIWLRKRKLMMTPLGTSNRGRSGGRGSASD